MHEKKVVNISIFFTLSWYTFYSTKKEVLWCHTCNAKQSNHVIDTRTTKKCKYCVINFCKKFINLQNQSDMKSLHAIVFGSAINHTFCGLMNYFLLRQIVNWKYRSHDFSLQALLLFVAQSKILHLSFCIWADECTWKIN